MTTSVVTRARALRRAATPPEVRLWSFLRTLRSKGHHFRRQAPVGAYVLDFVSYQDRLVIEVDGAQHGMAAQMARDAARDAVLATDVMGNLEGVAHAIREALAACSVHEGGGRRE